MKHTAITRGKEHSHRFGVWRSRTEGDKKVRKCSSQLQKGAFYPGIVNLGKGCVPSNGSGLIENFVFVRNA